MTDQFCDLVMEGGVTSGVVYPKAIVKLSQQFLFHSIGGSSVGAIAAAATAAAEYRRRLNPADGEDRGGFDLLQNLPDQLAPPPGRPDKESKLFALFSPQTETARIFTVLASALNRKSAATGIVAVILGLFRAYWLAALAAFVVAFALALLGAEPINVWGWVFLALLALLAALTTAVVRLVSDFVGPFVRNRFGICRGYNSGDEKKLLPGATGEPLTLWLSRLINRCAGLPDDGPPLTFGKLWEAPRFPPEWLHDVAASTPRRSIDLQMIATSLTHGRPFKFPDGDPDVPFYISPSELEDYFPPNVIEYLRDCARSPERDYPPPTVAEHPDLMVLPLASLPVVVAARMSLSFPFLLSAVPLYSVDYLANGKRPIKRCWFSDGGLTSNFPIHFFDSPLPLWPTFGISLERKDPEHQPEDIWMPTSNRGGRADRWDDLGKAVSGKSEGLEILVRFVGALLSSIRNWQDRLNARSPGVRDRVVRIRLDKAEGGLNLAMSRDQVAAVAKKGEIAGDELLARYRGIGSPRLPLAHAMDLDNHRWVRLRALVGAIEKDAPGLQAALNSRLPADFPSWNQLIAWAETIWTEEKDRCPVTANEAALMRADLGALNNLANTTGTPPGTLSTAPQRQPVLRLKPDA